MIAGLTTFGGLVTTGLGYVVWQNKKIVESYFSDQKEHGVKLGEIAKSLQRSAEGIEKQSVILENHASQCISGNEKVCALIDMVLAGDVTAPSLQHPVKAHPAKGGVQT